MEPPEHTDQRVKNARFNYRIGVLNGALFMSGGAFLNPTTVLPVFVKMFTGSDFIVGLVSAMPKAGWHLPQLFIAGYLEHRVYKLPVYLWANFARMTLSWMAILAVAYLALDRPQMALGAFVVLFGVSCFCGGIAGLPFTDIVGKTILKEQRGPFYAARFFLGAGILSVLAAVVIERILGHEVLFPFPLDFLLIFSIGVFMMSVAVVCFGFVREPPEKVSDTRRTFPEIFRDIPRIVREDANYGVFLAVQFLSAGIGFSLPFYIVLAQERFHAPAQTTGVFLAIQTFGVIFSNLVWGKLSSRRGNRSVIRFTVAAQVFAPVYTIVLSFGFAGVLAGAPGWLLGLVFAPVFFVIGCTMSGMGIGFVSYLLDIAPADRRPTYIGISNTILGTAALLPAAGGLAAGWVGLNSVFVLAAISVIAALVLSARLRP